ncbi:MAG: phosphosulfolactate synthase [Deltaproteobacteria bacterium]|nr:phosphosulfolactate synthase [Deltaproteobacteria bacterium]
MEDQLFLRDILELPSRSEKPRKVGRTICGISLGRGRESIEQVARYIDQVKLYVHNTIMPAGVIEEAIKTYRGLDIDVQMGGIFFELAALQGKLDAMVQRAKMVGVNVVEVENHLGAFSLNQLKQEIAKLKGQGFKIVGEVGAKWTEDDETRIAQGLCDPKKVILAMEQLLEAGADEVVWDAYPLRALIGNQLENEAGQDQIRQVAKAIGQDIMVFEVSDARGRGKSMHRAWLVHEFGPDVNIGNAHPGDISELETIRRGIYYDPAWPYLRWLKNNRPTKNWWEIEMPDYDLDIEPRPVWKYSGEEQLSRPEEAVPANRKR